MNYGAKVDLLNKKEFLLNKGVEWYGSAKIQHLNTDSSIIEGFDSSPAYQSILNVVGIFSGIKDRLDCRNFQ